MPSPYKHPKTGVYWYRQRVPAVLGSIAKGKTVTVTIEGKPSTPKVGSDIKISLGTKEPKVAKQRAKDAQDQFDLIWASFENSPVHLRTGMRSSTLRRSGRPRWRLGSSLWRTGCVGHSAIA
jgi:hypothetical protein